MMTMRMTVCLRAAAVVTLLHAAAHTIGGVFGQPAPGPASLAVEAMKLHQFPMMGHLRSYWDFQRGLGLAVTIFLTAEAVVFWQLSLLARTEGKRLRPIVASFAVAYALFALDSYAYFFAAAVVVELLILVCLGFAIFSAGSDNANAKLAQTPVVQQQRL